MRWVAALVLLALVACSVLQADASPSTWRLPTFGTPLGTDEFGRNLLLVLAISTGKSLALGAGLALIAGGLSILLAIPTSGRASPVSAAVLLTTQIIESVPLLLWVLVAFSAIGGQDMRVAAFAFVAAVLPFARAVLAGEFERLSREPYVEVARLCGASTLQIVRRHLLPNARPVIGPLFIQIAGLATAVPGAIGILGFSNRSDYDLGVILLRGRENVSDHPILLVGGLVAYSLIYLCLDVLRRGFRSAATAD